MLQSNSMRPVSAQKTGVIALGFFKYNENLVVKIRRRRSRMITYRNRTSLRTVSSDQVSSTCRLVAGFSRSMPPPTLSPTLCCTSFAILININSLNISCSCEETAHEQEIFKQQKGKTRHCELHNVSRK